MGALAEEDWANLKAYLHRAPDARAWRLELAKLVDDLELLLDLDHALPLEVIDTNGELARLVNEGRGLRLETSFGTWTSGSYRHTQPDTGRRAQTRSVYLDDETWAQVLLLGRPSDVIRAALQLYLEQQGTAPAPPEPSPLRRGG